MHFCFPSFERLTGFSWGSMLAIFWFAVARVPAQSPWVISAIHPDPTPSIGAPDAEYVALFARDLTLGCCPTTGLKLLWNGHERALPDSCWVTGSTLLVHRTADSVHFENCGLPKVGLQSWPALVNGGTTVALLDSTGQVLDAMPYSESRLEGGGRPLLRKDPWACGAGVNQVLWAAPWSPFEALGDTGGLQMQSGAQALLDFSGDFDRWVPRGLGHWEWRLAGPVDPATAQEATLMVGGHVVTAEWVSDSVVVARWSERVVPLSHSEGLGPSGTSVLLGPVRSCAARAETTWLKQTMHHLAQWGEVEPVEVLPDPQGPEVDGTQEHVVLVNRSTHVVDASGWDWDGGRLRRRRLLWPNQSVRFVASDFEHWPGLTNSGGQLQAFDPGGRRVAALSWSPCDHHAKSDVGRGLPLVRAPRRLARWNTQGESETDSPVQVTGFGCQRDWMGEVYALEIHLDRPLSFLPALEWQWATTAEPLPVQLGVHQGHDHPQTLVLPVSPGALLDVGWPSSAHLVGLGKESRQAIVSVPSFSCPSASQPGTACIRIDEILWDAADSGEEFVEVLNCGDSPVDLRGLVGSVAHDPAPGDWDEWVGLDRSVVLLPGQVMAFGECPKWFTSDHVNSGRAVWSVQDWSALSDAGGQLSLRLPSEGPHVLDSVHWTAGMEGPWWWSSDGWSWWRSDWSESGWTPSQDKGSPGRPQFSGMGNCEGDASPVLVSGATHGEPPSVHWDFPSPGHPIEVRMVGWPDGRMLGLERLGLDLARGSWTWNGRDFLGQPLPPQLIVLDVRWTGPLCWGRQSVVTAVPGYGK